MTVAEALAAAKKHGIEVSLDPGGVDLILSFEDEPPPEVVDLIKAMKTEIVDRLQTERGRINRQIAEYLIEWQDSCLQCRKPVRPGEPWAVVSNGDVTARFHRDCHVEWRQEQEKLARKALGFEP
jgi:hypothetical protein